MTECEWREKIAKRAYLKWEKAGYPPGDGVQFWLDAENELEREQPPKPKTMKVAAKRSTPAADRAEERKKKRK